VYGDLVEFYGDLVEFYGDVYGICMVFFLEFYDDFDGWMMISWQLQKLNDHVASMSSQDEQALLVGVVPFIKGHIMKYHYFAGSKTPCQVF